MLTIAWWYMAATYVMIWAGVLTGNLAWFFAAVASCYLQAIVFGIEDKSFLSFSCQVRYALAVILAAGLFEPLRWIYWIPIIGLTVRLTLNYCLLARLISLLPWNSKQPFSLDLFRRTIFSKPTKGSIAAL